MGYFFGGIAKLSVKIIILPFLYLVYLYGLYLAYLINRALAIYLLLLLKLTGFDPVISDIDEADDEEIKADLGFYPQVRYLHVMKKCNEKIKKWVDFQDAVSNIETEDVVQSLTE